MKAFILILNIIPGLPGTPGIAGGLNMGWANEKMGWQEKLGRSNINLAWLGCLGWINIMSGRWGRLNIKLARYRDGAI